MADPGIDLEKPRPLQWLVGVRTSENTTLFFIAANKNFIVTTGIPKLS